MDQIKDELIRCGTILFSEKGYKETKVKDVTDLASISVGTFYNYFDSKEELFLNIYMKKHNRAKKQLLELFNKNDEPINIIDDAIHKFIDIMKSDPVLRAFFNPNIHNKYRQNLDNDRKMVQFEYAYELFAPQLKKWQEDGEINNEIDIRLLLATIDSIFYILLHKNDIGERFFPDLLDLLISGLICKLKNFD